VFSNLLAILDPRAVFLTGSIGAFAMAALAMMQVRTVNPYGKPLALQALAQFVTGIALFFSAVCTYSFNNEFTLLVYVPAALGYGIAMASILLMYLPNLSWKLMLGGGALVLLGYVIWPAGVSIWVLIKSRDDLAPKARISAIALFLFFGLGVIPRVFYNLNPPVALTNPAALLDSPAFRLGVLVLAAMPVLLYACVLGTIQARIAAKLRQSVHHDMLTGAHSRRYLFEKGDALMQSLAQKKRLASGQHSGASVLMIDVDHFKKFNDTWGHLVGDRVLRHCVELMQQVVRDTDAIVCRYGGEEFCVLAPEMPLEHARVMSERIRSVIANNPYVHEDQPLPITVSIGVAQQPDQVTLAALIHTADERLYQAKRAGRNRVVDNTPGQSLPMSARSALR
jgi:diguanylate cyclase (GGDEF)-like protein